MPWSPLEAVSVFAIATGVGLVVATPLFALARTAGMAEAEISALLVPLSPLLIIATTLGVVATRHPGRFRALLGWRPAGPRDLAAGLGVAAVGYLGLNLALGALLQWLVVAAGYEVPVVQETFREAAASPRAVWGLVVGAVVLAPIGEELLYRGMLYAALRDRLGVGWGTWLSAGAFALTHASVGASWLSNGLLLAVIFPLGALFAWVYQRRGTLVAPIVAHAAFNAVNVAVLVTAPGAA